MRLKNMVVILFAAVAVSALNKTAEAAKPSEMDVMKAIASAEIARKKARSVEGEWRDTGKLIREAEEAFNTGDYVKAIDLAKEAQIQGELGYSQARSQQELQLPSYYRY